MDMLAYNPLEFNYSDTLANTLIISYTQNQFFQENVFINSPSVCYSNEKKFILHSLYRTLKIFPGSSSSILDKIENLNVVNQS